MQICASGCSKMHPESPGFIPLLFGAAVVACSLGPQFLKDLAAPVANCAHVTMVVGGGVDDKGNAVFEREQVKVCVTDKNNLEVRRER